MKHFIWMLCGIFISGLLLGTLSACGADQFGVTVITTAKGPAAGADPAPAEAEIPAEAPAEDTERRLAYGKALWDAYQQGVLPGGDPLDWLDLESAATNAFALWDVDGDGEEELLLNWTNAGMAGMMCVVFGYRDGSVYEELREFPSIAFYDNGVAEADWSHNQGLGGRFWPFSAYRYNGESGVYESVGGVDAWDGGYRDPDFDGNPFPHELDADGDLLLYFLLPANWQGQYDMDLTDGPAFENWRNTYLDGAEKIEIPFQPLTEENIAALGYPKPGVTYPEPAG